MDFLSVLFSEHETSSKWIRMISFSNENKSYYSYGLLNVSFTDVLEYNIREYVHTCLLHVYTCLYYRFCIARSVNKAQLLLLLCE